MARPFWKYPMMGKTHEFAMYWAESGLGQQALNEKKTLTHFSHGGTLKSEIDADALVNELLKSHQGMRVVYRKLPDTYSRGDEWILASGDLAVNIDYTVKNRAVTFSVYGTDDRKVTEMQIRLKHRTTRKVTKGRVYIVVSGDSGPYLHEMGTAGEDFIGENYRPEVVKEYAHVVEDLNNPDPCGRIVILDGPPGTGKTHMVRALLNEVPKGTFVLIPSNMMSQLGSPSFIKAVLREQKKGYPMILVVEDADEAISSRKADNISEISALLNFSDGIFGSLLDLRILCTTNADVESLDAAVMRPGRLCRRIEVGKLDHVQAEAVYKRLGGTETGRYGKGNFYTLGEIYQDARGAGGATAAAPRKTSKGRLGFQLAVEDEPVHSESPAAEMGLNPGDVISTDEGDIVRVRANGQLEMVKQGPVMTVKPALQQLLDAFEGDGYDDDDDLIDEDPEETPEYDEDDED
jgi:hypothetical protein